MRPLLEYGAEVWHPHLIKDTLALENVQKLALRICSKQWQMSYFDLLDRFKLPTLENRRLFLSLCTFFKIIHNISFFPSALIPPHLSSSSLRSSNCNNFLISFARTEQSANSFILRTIKLWSNLFSLYSCKYLYCNMHLILAFAIMCVFSPLKKKICICYTMPSRDLCKIHEGMFDKPEGVARGFITHSRVFLHRSHGMAWYS